MWPIGILALIFATTVVARAVRLHFGLATSRSSLLAIGIGLIAVAIALHRVGSPLTDLLIPLLVSLGVFDRDTEPMPPWWAVWRWRWRAA